MLEGNPMKMITAVIAGVLTAALMLHMHADAQAPKSGPTFTIAGRAGETQLLQVNGKSYVEVEALARLTKGTLSFKANATILTLPPRMERSRHPSLLQRRGSQELLLTRALKRWA